MVKGGRKREEGAREKGMEEWKKVGEIERWRGGKRERERDIRCCCSTYID